MLRRSSSSRLALAGSLLAIGFVSVASEPVAGQSSDERIVPFTIRVPDAVLADLKARLARPRFPPPLQDGWTHGTDVDLSQEPGHLLARQVRLARAGAKAEPVQPLHDQHRRIEDSLHPSEVEAPERLPAAHHARLAGIVRRVHEGHRPADRPDRARRARHRRLRSHRPVDSGLRLLGQADDAGLRSGAGRADGIEADGAPRLPALRRTGRRLGRHHQHPARADRFGPHGGVAPQHVHRRSARSEREAD